MKKFYLAGVPALLGVLFLLQVPSSGPAHAISGCCKQSTDGVRWHAIHRDFKRCKAQNAAEKDNVFQPSGQFWWDTRC
ncbi:MAG: hypothetical protein V3S40_07590 [Kiloniellales bacterium]